MNTFLDHVVPICLSYMFVSNFSHGPILGPILFPIYLIVIHLLKDYSLLISASWEQLKETAENSFLDIEIKYFRHNNLTVNCIKLTTYLLHLILIVYQLWVH